MIEDLKMDEREQILVLLRTLSGHRINVCGEIYEILRKSGEQAGKLLKYFYEISETITSSEEREARVFLSEGEVEDYIRRYGKIVDGILENMLIKKPDKETFYIELWKKLNLESLFEDDKSRIFALYYVWIDIRIPYFELPETVRLEEEEYRCIVKKISEKIQETRFIFASDFQKWTEVSSLLLKLMEDMNQNEKIVFLACAMQMRDKMFQRSVAEAGEEQ